MIHKFEKENIADVNERIYSVFSAKKTNNDYFNPVSGANISTSKITFYLVLLLPQYRE